MDNDNWARGMLADPDLGPEPLSKVDVRLAVRRGRRRIWARRTTVAMAATGAAVTTAVSLPLAVPGTDTVTVVLPSLSASASSSAPATRVPSRPLTAPTGCTREPMEMPAGMFAASVHAGDPTGRYAVGITYRAGGGQALVGADADRLVLWDNGKATVFDPPRSGRLQAIEVNASGTVSVSVSVDTGTPTSTINWTYRDGTFTELSTPDGNYTAVGINARGDVVGAWLHDAGVHPPVIWPAGAPGSPRALVGGDPGDEAVARVGGVDDDGTVVGVITSGSLRVTTGGSIPPPPDPLSRPVFWPADGAPARELPMPPGFGPNGYVYSVRAGLAAGRVSRPDPDADRRGDRAAIWDLPAGTVTVDDRLSHAEGVNPHGWLVGRGSQEPPAPPVAVFAGAVVPLPMLVAPDSGGGVGISDDGRIITGSARIGARMTPVRWICT